MFNCLKSKKPRSGSEREPDTTGPNVSDSGLRMFYPRANWMPELKLLKSRYKLDFAKPENIVILIHHTAAWQNQTAESFFKYFLKKNLCTDFLREDGQVFQQRHGDRVGSNAGDSKFKGRSNVSKFAIALEVAGGGKLKLRDSNGTIKSWSKSFISDGSEIVTYFGKKVPNARYVTTAMGYEETGWYEPFSEAQESEIVEYIKHWMTFGIPAENIVGHDEVAGKKYLGRQRKNDPGGSLSMPLAEFVRKRVL